MNGGDLPNPECFEHCLCPLQGGCSAARWRIPAVEKRMQVDTLCASRRCQPKCGEQLLFVAMTARSGIQTAVSFFTIRVKEPDKDNWCKLRHYLMYLKGTLYMKRHLSADALTSLMWLVDGS